ncbi:P-loop containing nucleoside triphosphate hydrolases superfamily protein [Tasmannia lanceolata]|uniref:P-loop containing nucleoside triphosphate hydrolases superfamily protein n=1 Tax=Tasmannia lanceolata TaxID=3420 RepID=UPI004063BEE8
MRLPQTEIVSLAKGREKRKPPPSSQSRPSGHERERFRVRKKQKRLDAIRDLVIIPREHGVEGGSGTVDSEAGLVRRSSRLRGPPVYLDLSPSPVKRKPKIGNAAGKTNKNSKDSVNRNKGKARLEKLSPGEGLEEEGNWRSRLRSRVQNVNVSPKGKGSPARAKRKFVHELDFSGEESKLIREKGDDGNDGLDGAISHLSKLRRMSSRVRESTDAKSGDQITGSSNNKGDSEERTLREWLHSIDEAPSPLKNAIGRGSERVADDSSAQIIEKEDGKFTANLQVNTGHTHSNELETIERSNDQLEQPNREEGRYKIAVGDDSKHPNASKERMPSTDPSENDCCRTNEDAHPNEVDNKQLEDGNGVKVNTLSSVSKDAGLYKPRIREGRRCGLCGGGIDGKPPKKLARDSAESDAEAYGGSSSSEEPNYDIWDGFGDEPGWLGRLLGPIHDRFGIAGVWVHQHCAVWSPEVYFAGLGRLKNVRAALCRGRALKCSRCGRPGATIGCRVDRCPKTYHLPCGRADGCIFDHRKFLIACTDHRHLFQLQGNHYKSHIKKLRARKMRLDMRKLSTDASRKDLEAEEKWLENCGEDEEFLRREGKRLHRDISRIAPVYIGGPFPDSEKLHQGWESVAGLQDVIQCMKEVVILPLLYPEFFSTLGITPPRGVLLHGYPGTGKTLVVRALIGACSRGDKRIAYFARKGADCLGKYVGDAERQLRLLFQVAERCQPSIIFFDEIDGLAPRRSKQQDQTHSSVVSTLLALLDGLKSRGSVIVIGATNRPEAVDAALRRPGRFDREIYFPLPSVKDRSSILSLHTQSWPKPVAGFLLTWIAEKTAGFAGADLQALCTQAAMIALKRNCALHELLSAAEKYPCHGRRLSLPSLVVEERDWLDALACAPPPCSRREAGMAANDVVSAPLPAHLIPCLLHPLTYLLLSFYHDERIRLPPSIFKAAKLINSVITSVLEQKKTPILLWTTHLRYLIQDPDVAKELERSLSRAGLISTLAFPISDPLDNDNDDNNYGKLGIHRLNPSGGHTSSSLMQNFSFSHCNRTGFRVLVAGNPRSGQRHLSACLLHGFVGHVEIQKVNLATISQEGRGDMVKGLTHILLKCLSVGQCIIYMPRIDLWAMDETHHQTTEKDSSLCSKTFKSPKVGLSDAVGNASEAWNSFVEQVESMSMFASLMILATCEMPNHVLPARVRQFFSADILNSTGSAPSEHTIPRFFVQVDGTFNHDLIFSSSAEKLSWDLVKQYVQLSYRGTHMGNSCKEIENCDTLKVNSEVQNHKAEEGKTNEEMGVATDSEGLALNADASCKGNQTQQSINGDKRWSLMSKTSTHQEDQVWLQSHQDSVLRSPPSRVVKGKHNLLLTIATFGYQILQYPHFAELCWATSKLKEGPCTGINGPWKGWPFNSCFIRANSSVKKEDVGSISSITKNRENSDVVRGLVAVGLLAYRGVYTSVREVSLEVRKVLELLVGQINIKIRNGKDRYRFLRLLSQVAYLEDMVSSWVYTTQSLELESQVSSSSSNKPMIVGRLDTENQACGSSQFGTGECMPNVSNERQKEVKLLVEEESPLGFAPGNSKCGDSSKGVTPGLPNSDTSIARTVLLSHELVPSAPFPPGILQSSALASGSFSNENTMDKVQKSNHLESCSSENPVSSPVLHGELESLNKYNGFAVMETVMPSRGNLCALGDSRRASDQRCNGTSVTDTSLPSENGGCNPDQSVGVMNSNFRKNSNLPSQSVKLCLYNCCCECIHAVHVLVREILTDSWESNACGSTIEDVHDVVETCSATLLAAITKHFVAGFCDGNLQRGTPCACQDVGNIRLQEMSHWSKSLGKREVMPMECLCHSKSKEVRTTNACKDSLFGSGLKFFFRDYVLMPSVPDKDAVFHCEFENLCLCSTIEKILMIKQPLN